jgi:hypothetical protein
MKKWFVVVTLFLGNIVCNGQTQDQGVDEFINCVFHLSEVMLHDVTNPPAAARFYAYTLLGAYESSDVNDSDLPKLTSHFRMAPGFESEKTPDHFLRMFCATYAMLEVGRQILPSGYLLEEKQAKLIALYKKKFKASKFIEENKLYAIKVASRVVEYSKSDGYFSLSTLPRYTPNMVDEGHWYPTPPEYMSAVEPQWKTLRTFFLDSANQFPPVEPIPFSKEKGSDFFEAMNEVYKTTADLSEDQKSIAAFWDCNPFALAYSGHAAIGLKKISPGGHWIGITGIACRKTKASFDKTLLAHTLVSLALHDAFVSCWTEKYRCDRIRPESAINKYLDPSWRPLLQTPPFPEYTSGHSVVSTATAEILTQLFGDGFEYTDTSEEYFGLPPRSFHSFREAANEAAISRMYGGIHFRDAIEVGQQQGKNIGNYIIQKVKLQGLSNTNSR